MSAAGPIENNVVAERFESGAKCRSHRATGLRRRPDRTGGPKPQVNLLVTGGTGIGGVEARVLPDGAKPAQFIRTAGKPGFSTGCSRQLAHATRHFVPGTLPRCRNLR
jgi:hypothetical protein